MAEAGVGRINLFNDFTGVGTTVALTGDTSVINGGFFAGGEGNEDGTAGIADNIGLLSGVVTVTSGATDVDTTFIGTQLGFDAGLMGTIILETRVQMPDVDTKEIFFGLTSLLIVDTQLADVIANASATAVSLVSELAGFYMSDELTASATEWHGFYNGGTTAGVATAANVNLGTANSAGITAGEWQQLRLEIDTNGTVRWLINGDLKQTVAGAVSTTTNYAVMLAAAANSANACIFECDYLKVAAGRDWTV